jgi:16S rRNA (cytosine1402-N4)-methyltransferase
MASAHLPVLRDQVVAELAPAAPGLLVDVTVGLGGHALALLEAAPGFRLLGLDRDPHALARADALLEPHSTRVHLVEAVYSDLPRLLDSLGEEPPAAILADLGCSSLQLDTPERGFSFLNDGPLDMRMGGDGATAADLVNSASEEELMRILWTLGEERRSRAIARAIVRRRRRAPLSTTGDLVDVIVGVLGPQRRGRVHPATRSFMAIRMAVNAELDHLEHFVEPATLSLRPGGRVAIISFHSLEDRIVKHTLRRLEGRCTCPPALPECRCNPQRKVRVLTRKPMQPTADEIAVNPRARSARLRVAERCSEDA